MRLGHYIQMIRTLTVGALFVAALTFGQVALAHGTGASWEKVLGNLTIDVGYDGEFVEGQSTRFDFALKDAKSGGDKKYDYVWVKVIRDHATALAVGVSRQAIGPTTLLYTFGDDGPYVLEASFRTESGDEIAAASFPFDVEGRTQSDGYLPLPLLLAIVALVSAASGAAATFFLLRGRWVQP